ncbi:MAG: hypothetical protein AAGE18_14910 [Pseudomonadota bacterium]
MGRLVLHIGMHKTGTSSIQRFLSRNRQLLAAFGIDYTTARGRDGRRLPKHNDLFRAITAEKDHGAPDPDFGASAGRIAALGARVARIRGTVVVSAEGLSGPDPAFAQALAPLTGLDVRVVVFLRRQDMWVESFYTQMIRNQEVREHRSFADFLADPATRAQLDYAGLLGRWGQVFGRERLAVVAFDGREPPVAAFLRAAGLPEGLARLPHGRAWLNTMPPPDALRRLRAANTEDATTPTEAPLGFVSEEERAAFLADYEDTTAQIAAAYGVTLPGISDA